MRAFLAKRRRSGRPMRARVGAVAFSLEAGQANSPRKLKINKRRLRAKQPLSKWNKASRRRSWRMIMGSRLT